MTIDSQGRIANSGTINAPKQIAVKAAQGIENTGRIEAKTQNIELQSQGDIQQHGSVIAQTGRVNAKAKNTLSQRGETVAKNNISYKAADVKSTQSSLIAAGVTTTQTKEGESRQLDTQSAQGSVVDIQANNTLQLAGRHIASGKLDIRAQSINLDNSQNAAYDIGIQAKSGDVQANQSQLSAVKKLQISTPKTLSTQQSYLNAQEIASHQHTLISNKGIWIQRGNSPFTLTVSDKLENNGGTFATQGDFSIRSVGIDNQQGRFIAGRDLTIQNGKSQIDSSSGLLSAGQNISISSGKLVNDDGLIQTKGNLSLHLAGQQLSNQHTLTVPQNKGIVAVGMLDIQSGDINNNQGRIVSGQHQQIAARNLTNNDGLIHSHNSLLLVTNQLQNDRGTLVASKQGVLQLRDSLSQSSGKIGLQSLNLVAKEVNSTTNSTITAENIQIHSLGKLNNTQSFIHATDKLSVHSMQLNNSAGTISSQKGSIVLDSQQQTLINQKGHIIAQEDISLNTGKLDNTAGQISTREDLEINTWGQTVTNDNGKVVAGSSVVLQTGQWNNKNGLIQANGDLTLNTSSQLLNNQQGNILGNKSVAIQSARLNNYFGYIQAQDQLAIDTTQQNLNNNKGNLIADHITLKTGNMTNHEGIVDAIMLSGDMLSLSQNTGTLQAKDQLTLNVKQSLSSNNQSHILGGEIKLLTGQLSNQNSEIVALRQDVHLNTDDINNQQGVILSQEGNLHINSRNLGNQQGKLSAAMALEISSNTLNNTQGLIQSKADMQINTHKGNLINQQTKLQSEPKGIISLGKMTLQTQSLQNINGNILSQNEQNIVANQFDNHQGIVSTLSSQILNIVQKVNNQLGRITAKAGKLNTNALDNHQGTVQATEHLNIDTQQLINTQGNIKADQHIAIHSAWLNNKSGNIDSLQGTLALQTQFLLNNQNGNIKAKGASTITVLGLDNSNGLLYTEVGKLAINTSGKSVNNHHGKIISHEQLTLSSGELINTKGNIFAEKNALIQASSINNSQLGNIAGLSNFTLQTGYLNNQSGQIRVQNDIQLQSNGAIDNQAVNHSGSLIESGGKLTINTSTFNNQKTVATQKTPTQGILATNLVLTANHLNNMSGGIYSRQNSKLAINQVLDNTQGEILSTGNAEIIGKDLEINNLQGKLQASNRLSISATELTSDGHLEADDLQIRLKNDFNTSNHINANHSLLIETQGNLTNNHHLYTDDKVILSANNIENTQNGRISSALTSLTAKNTVLNEGLINSISEQGNSQTLITANQIMNRGMGRIYGDHIALQADIVSNEDKFYAANNTIAAVVAARTRLDIAAKEIYNKTTHYLPNVQNNAIMFSGGDIHIGRTLDGNFHAQNKADKLQNDSSIIEAEGNITFNATSISNNNIHFSVEHVETGKPVNDITFMKEEANNEHYIIPADRWKTNFLNAHNGIKGELAISEDPQISMKYLKWASFSRAGKLVYQSDGSEPTVLTPGDVITPDMVLAARDETVCANYGEQNSGCHYLPAGQYGPDSPIWAYAGVNPPAEPAPHFPFSELEAQPWYKINEWFELDESTNEFDTFIVPKNPGAEPKKPVQRAFESDYRYNLRLARYEEALASYPLRKAKWEFYLAKIAPYIKWTEKYQYELAQVDAKIEQHNNARIRNLNLPEYYRFWDIRLNKHREDESKVLTTQAGQILAGGNLDFDSQSFINDRSSIIAGGTLQLKDKIQNIDELGMHRVTDTGTSQFTYSKWRGGIKRYFQRKWSGKNDYIRVLETPFDMQIYKLKEEQGNALQNITADNHRNGISHTLSLNPLNNTDDTQINNLAKMAGGRLDSVLIPETLSLSGQLNAVETAKLWQNNKTDGIENSVSAQHPARRLQQF